jgi:hypothetical protein
LHLIVARKLDLARVRMRERTREQEHACTCQLKQSGVIHGRNSFAPLACRPAAQKASQ